MRLFNKIFRKIFPFYKLSFSQFGEDLILESLFNQLEIRNPTYLDIGANDPRYINNSYYFYLHGSRGVLIEPNEYLYKKNKKIRPRDIVLNVGVGISNVNEADFYLFPNFANGLSTFSEAEALHWKNVGMKGLGKINYEKVVRIPLISIDTILETYFSPESPNLISLDIEGLDFDILKAINFNKYTPDVICVETMGYDEKGNTFKKNDIIDYLKLKGYWCYADTRVNTIFVRSNFLQR